MKKFFAFLLATALLCACAVPAGAISYRPNVPTASIPKEYLQAQETFEADEAVRLGLVPPTIQGEYEKAVTRLEFVETLMTTVAAHWNYDLENFAAICAINPPVKLATEYRAGVFSDVGKNTALDWAYALGVVSGEGNGKFNPSAAVSASGADKLIANAAVLLGVDAVTSGASASCTRGECLSACYRLYNVAGKAVKPLLSYKDEVKRLADAFDTDAEKHEYDMGTVLYGMRDGAPALCVAYVDGGARRILLSDDSLTFIDPIMVYSGLLRVYGTDSAEYEIDLRTGRSVPVAQDSPAGVQVVGAGEAANVPGQERAKNEFGRYAQNVPMVNNSAAPHAVGFSYMPIYTDNGKAWALEKDQWVVLSLSAVRAENYPQGQSINVGYILNGKMVEISKTVLLGDLTLSFRVPEAGKYTFYLENRSGTTMYITSTQITFLIPESFGE